MDSKQHSLRGKPNEGTSSKRSSCKNRTNFCPKRLCRSANSNTFKCSQRSCGYGIERPRLDKARNECKDTGCVVRDCYQTFMQKVILNVDLKTIQIRNINNFVSHCKVSERRCVNTSLDLGAYTRNQPENCFSQEILSVYIGQMIKFNDQYFISTDPKSKLEDPNFFSEIFNDQQKICGHPPPVYPTN